MLTRKELRALRPPMRPKNEIRFSPNSYISLLEQWPKCISLI